MSNFISSPGIPDVPHARDNYRQIKRLKLGKDKTVIRYCKRHKKPEPISSKCFREKRRQSAALHIYKPFYSLNLGDEPVLIESKAQHRMECKKRGLRCPE